MESKLVKLKTDFNNIINVRTTVKNIFDILQIRIDKLKILYAEFIKTSKNQMFVFGLDSFHFQSKLIDLEFDTIKQLYQFIDNHMYCDYYKLFIVVNKFYIDNFKEEITINKYPVYKDLEPYKEYDYDTVNNIHQDI